MVALRRREHEKALFYKAFYGSANGSRRRLMKRSIFAIVAFLLLLGSARRSAAGVVTITDMRTLVAAVERSRAATVSSYVLPSSSALARALVRAAKKGSDVVLVLDSETIGPGARQSVANTVRTLGRAGVKIRMSSGPLHLKAALIDQRVVYLSDRNFTSTGAIIVSSSDPDDYNAVLDAMYHGPRAGSARLRVYKKDSLALEASIIANGSGPVSVETESMSAGNAAYDALVRRARRSHVRLIVSADELEDGHHQREQQEVAELRRDGVDVRVGRSNEKILVQSDSGYVGSANLSGGSAAVQDQPDWGMAVDPGPVLDALRQHFEDDWTVAVEAR